MQPHTRYSLIDYATQIYLVLVAIFVLLFGRDIQLWWAYVAGHAIIAGLIHLLVKTYRKHPQNRLVSLLRYLYPIILYTAFYRETGELNHLFIGGYIDEFLITIEQRIFGLQPAVVLMQRFSTPWISELLYASYFSYYVMIVGVGIVLYIQHKERCFHYITVVSFIFYVCYLTYIIVPAIGGRAFWTPIEGLAQGNIPFYPLEFPQSIQNGIFYQLMGFIYHHFEAEGAAFPSSHTAIALTTLYFSWQYLPRIRYFHAVAVILLLISTVYCRYHYMVDIYAGVATFAVLLVIAETLYSKLHRA
jgi:membrane-associated phospholipid phosphatase